MEKENLTPNTYLDTVSDRPPACCQRCVKSDVCKYKEEVKVKVEKLYDIVKTDFNLPLRVNPVCASFCAKDQ